MSYDPPKIFVEFNARNREKIGQILNQISELNQQLNDLNSLRPQECVDAIHDSLKEYIKPLCDGAASVEFYYNGNYPSDSELWVDGVVYNRRGQITSGSSRNHQLPEIVAKSLFNELILLREETAVGRFLDDYVFLDFS